MTRAKNELYLFWCKDKASEFTAEISESLPVELIDENDLFSSLKTKLCGKTYTDREKGRGVIKAQCEDRLLVCYADGEAELKSLAELMADRDTTVQYIQPKKQAVEAPKPTVQIAPGMKLTHKTFGDGEVISIEKDYAQIRFAEPNGIKKLLLSMCIEKGLITV